MVQHNIFLSQEWCGLRIPFVQNVKNTIHMRIAICGPPICSPICGLQIVLIKYNVLLTSILFHFAPPFDTVNIVYIIDNTNLVILECKSFNLLYYDDTTLSCFHARPNLLSIPFTY